MRHPVLFAPKHCLGLLHCLNMHKLSFQATKISGSLGPNPSIYTIQLMLLLSTFRLLRENNITQGHRDIQWSKAIYVLNTGDKFP